MNQLLCFWGGGVELPARRGSLEQVSHERGRDTGGVLPFPPSLDEFIRTIDFVLCSDQSIPFSHARQDVADRCGLRYPHQD